MGDSEEIDRRSFLSTGTLAALSVTGVSIGTVTATTAEAVEGDGTSATEGTATQYDQVAKLVGDDTGEDDAFGTSIAVAGDTALVGASGTEDPNGQGAGAAYVFERSGGEWIQQAQIAAADGDTEDYFGVSVALAGDTALVGALGEEDPNGTRAGAAYVFERTDGTWSQQAKIIGSDTDEGDAFGGSVALDDSGDVALVGATGDESQFGASRGAAYVFERSGGSWTQRAQLVPETVDGGDIFGTSVALANSGDTALVGAVLDGDANEWGPGAAFVFERDDGDWTLRTQLVSEDADLRDVAYGSIALDDAGDTALMSARFDDDPNGKRAGSTYVFTLTDGKWVQQAKLVPEDGDSFDRFGSSVGLAGDGSTAIVGAIGDEDPNGTDTNDHDPHEEPAGSAYVFTRNDGEWTQQAKLAADDGDNHDQFGNSVAIASDGSTALIGAQNDEAPTTGEEGAGSVYVFGSGDERKSGTTEGTETKTPAEGASTDTKSTQAPEERGEETTEGTDKPTPEERSEVTTEETDTQTSDGRGGATTRTTSTKNTTDTESQDNEDDPRSRGTASQSESGSDQDGGQGMPGFGLGTGVAALGGGVLWHRFQGSGGKNE